MHTIPELTEHNLQTCWNTNGHSVKQKGIWADQQFFERITETKFQISPLVSAGYEIFCTLMYHGKGLVYYRSNVKN